jgi:PAS domain S-box-containing protein
MRIRPVAPEDQLEQAYRLQLLLEAVTDYAIFMLDTDGRVSSWNSGAQKLKGYEPSEIIGQPFSRFFTEEDRARELPATLLAEALKRGRCEAEGLRVRKDGGTFWALAVLQPAYDESGRHVGFAKVTRDITERRAAQQALYESERRFRLLVQGVVDYAIFMLDPSGIIINWNTGAQRIKGYRAEEVIGRHFGLFLSPKDRAAGLPARALEIARREGRFEDEGWRYRKDGSRFWASVVLDAIHDDNGDLLGFAKITRDITERRKDQEQLRESERQFRSLVKGVSDYALYMLDPNGIISSWNAGAERIKGYSSDEVMGRHFSLFYPDADRLAGVPTRALATALEKGGFEAEGWRIRKDGTMFLANVVIDPIRDEDGTLIGFAKITRDITERRAAEAALQKAQAQLVQSQKMEALGQLTGGVAHDFNNLLMIVSSHVQTLKKLAANDPKGLRAAQAIEIASRRGEALTRQLLTFSRRQSLNATVVDLNERLDALKLMLGSSMGGAIHLVTTVLPGTWPVRVDANELELAIFNVALNARDAMPRGGVLTISAENAAEHSGMLPKELSGDYVAFSIADSGLGIPEDILPKVFDPFFTTKEAGKGTGLGLSQVHGFVHQSGGTVTISSEIGQGTVVTLYLPRAKAGEQLAAPAGEPAEQATGAKSVLLIEDNPEVAEVTADLLRQLGHQVTAVNDAATGLVAITQQTFDIVLSDIVMTGSMNGLDLARAIRERRPGIPVVLATGYSKVAEEAAREFPVLRKPYQLSDLGRVLSSALASAQHSSNNLVRLDRTKRERTSGAKNVK